MIKTALMSRIWIALGVALLAVNVSLAAELNAQACDNPNCPIYGQTCAWACSAMGNWYQGCDPILGPGSCGGDCPPQPGGECVPDVE